MSKDDDFNWIDETNESLDNSTSSSNFNEESEKRNVATQQPSNRENIKSQSNNGLPNPNNQVKKPVNKPTVDYNKNSSSGAHIAHGENVGLNSPQQRVMNNQSNTTQNRQVSQTNRQNTQTVRKNSQPMQKNNQQVQRDNKVHNQVNQPNNAEVSSQPSVVKKKKLKLPLIIVGALVLIIIIGLCVFKFLGSQKQVAQTIDYNTSGKYALDNFVSKLSDGNFDATTIDQLIGVEDGDSYLAQEWAYVNGVPLREEFIIKMTSVVKFSYPQVVQMSTKNEPMLNEDGSQIMIESYMNDGEKTIVTIPDYEKLTATMDEEIKYIQAMYSQSGFKTDDYTWNDDLTNLMLQYICDKDVIPTKEVELNIPVNLSGTPYIENDIELDNALFGSDDFHKMCAKFSQICTGWVGYTEEHYTEKEEQHNPEYDEWFVLFNQYYTADNGVYNQWSSKWEPFYKVDENGSPILDENGQKVIDYYTVKKDDGTVWKEPSKTILVDVDKVKKVEAKWVEETGIHYNFIGQYYIHNEYEGSYSTIVRVGDGSKSSPAGIDTSIITKVLCTDGKYHDVKVSLVGYWKDQDAIDYAERFSTKNRGLTTDSPVRLICFEVLIENLENTHIEFVSEMTLADKNTNISSRTGTMYGFTQNVKLDAYKSVVINDWATSTELDQKYVCWGKSFSKNIDMVYFNILAGSGDIPPYSAYEQFTGKGQLNESDSTDK